MPGPDTFFTHAMHRTTLFITELLIIIVLLCLKDRKMSYPENQPHFVTSSIFWKCKLLFLAEENRPSSLSETNSNLVCFLALYVTPLSSVKKTKCNQKQDQKHLYHFTLNKFCPTSLNLSVVNQSWS